MCCSRFRRLSKPTKGTWPLHTISRSRRQAGAIVTSRPNRVGNRILAPVALGHPWWLRESISGCIRIEAPCGRAGAVDGGTNRRRPRETGVFGVASHRRRPGARRRGRRVWLTRPLFRLRRRWSCGPGGRTSPTSHDLVQFPGIKAYEFWDLAARVFAIYLDEACDEELLFLVGLSLPEVGFSQGDKKSSVANPFAMGGVNLGASVGLDVSEVVEVPCLAD